MARWKSFVVEGYKGELEVSDDGRVRRKGYEYDFVSRHGTEAKGRKPDQELRPDKHSNGYLRLVVYINKRRTRLYIHRLVAEAFVPGKFENAHVNHINGRKDDNRAENLEWVTNAQNIEKAWQDGLVDLRGEKHPSSKLTEQSIHEIKRLAADGMSNMAIARKFSICNSMVGHILKGRRWAIVA